jgi:hypothetical protein
MEFCLKEGNHNIVSHTQKSSLHGNLFIQLLTEIYTLTELSGIGLIQERKFNSTEIQKNSVQESFIQF